jgi:hypothetical protein
MWLAQWVWECGWEWGVDGPSVQSDPSEKL